MATNRSLLELARSVDGRLIGDGELGIAGVGSLQNGTSELIGFIADPRFLKLLPASNLAAVIVSPAIEAELDRPGIVVANPHLAFARIAALYDRRPRPLAGIHATASVAPGVEIPEDVWVGPGVVIEASVSIGAGSLIGPGCVIGAESSIGERCQLLARVILCHDVEIGSDCLIHPGVVIGSDGFGLALDGERWVKVPQVGRVVIGDHCEIGANTTIDRGAIDDTVIDNGVKIDNQVQIAHNVQIGEHTAIAGCVGIAGSASIGRRCRIGGNAGILGHLEICDDTTIMAKSLVTKSIQKPGIYSSAIPAADQSDWARQLGRLRQLDSLAKRVRQLEDK